MSPCRSLAANLDLTLLSIDLALYTKGDTGESTFHLKVNDVTGLYHYRIMVNYPGTTIHCVYESIPFMILQNPDEKYHSGGQ
ncbi:hypothetical protein [Absidia glauca]|uniref:Uncharacterized protein n=1 Tax=Absidia glauca TaxID=4829 RepID=A0A163J1K1_ABSGL|nr:hypothetical protein [Absidia glauca]